MTLFPQFTVRTFLKLGYKSQRNGTKHHPACNLNRRPWGNELSFQPLFLDSKAQRTLLRCLHSWYPGDKVCQEKPWASAIPHTMVDLDSTHYCSGMLDRHRPQAERVCWLLHHLDTAWATKRASNAILPWSNLSSECLKKAHFSNAMTGGPLRGGFFHPLVESTYI